MFNSLAEHDEAGHGEGARSEAVPV